MFCQLTFFTSSEYSQIDTIKCQNIYITSPLGHFIEIYYLNNSTVK